MSVRRPQKRKISWRTLSRALGGPEPKPVVYEFPNGRRKTEPVKHNPFA